LLILILQFQKDETAAGCGKTALDVQQRFYMSSKNMLSRRRLKLREFRRMKSLTSSG